MADGQAGLRGQAPDLVLDLVKPGDALQPVLGDRGGAVAGDFEKFAAGMGPATGKPDGRTSTVRLDQTVMPGIAVRRANSPPDCLLSLLPLQDAGEALQNVIGIMAAAPRRICGYRASQPAVRRTYARA